MERARDFWNTHATYETCTRLLEHCARRAMGGYLRSSNRAKLAVDVRVHHSKLDFEVSGSFFYFYKDRIHLAELMNPMASSELA